MSKPWGKPHLLLLEAVTMSACAEKKSSHLHSVTSKSAHSCVQGLGMYCETNNAAPATKVAPNAPATIAAPVVPPAAVPAAVPKCTARVPVAPCPAIVATPHAPTAPVEIFATLHAPTAPVAETAL